MSPMLNVDRSLLFLQVGFLEDAILHTKDILDEGNFNLVPFNIIEQSQYQRSFALTPPLTRH